MVESVESFLNPSPMNSCEDLPQCCFLSPMLLFNICSMIVLLNFRESYQFEGQGSYALLGDFNVNLQGKRLEVSSTEIMLITGFFQKRVLETIFSLTKNILLGSSEEDIELMLGQFVIGYIQNIITPDEKIEQAKSNWTLLF